MIPTVGRARFVPRQDEAAAERRRQAAFRAAIDDLTSHIARLQKEQDIQLQRIAQIQQDLDELKKIVRANRS